MDSGELFRDAVNFACAVPIEPGRGRFSEVRTTAKYWHPLMKLARLAILSSVALPAGLCPFGVAAAGEAPIGAVATSSQKPSAGDTSSDAEIVVTAARRGEAKVAAETEFSDEEIASHGSDSIQELLNRLAPFIKAGGDEPVILINGKPVGFDRSILSYPTEALERLAVLKPEAATLYGEAAGRRVVNLVIKTKFSMLNVDTGANFATGGGKYGGNLSVGRTAINGDTRWNAQARIGRDTALRKDARNIPRPVGRFDSIGFVSAIDGGEIDPELSSAAGQLVTVAAIPIGSMSENPVLADFAATANERHDVDPHAFDTFQSSGRNMSLNIGVTRPLGTFSASLNLNANKSSGAGLRGLPMASVIVPAGSPWSPFADDIMLTRPFAGKRPLRTENDSSSFGGSLSVNGAIGGWQTSLGVNYSRNVGRNLLETGIDVARVQQLIDAADAGFNPYGIWDDSLLLASRSRTRSESLSGRFQVQKNIIDLPAGPISSSFSLNASRGRSESSRSDNRGGPAVVNKATRQQLDGQLSLSIPISRRGETELGPLGDLSVDLSMSGQTMANGPLQKRFNGGVNWSPFSIVELRGSLDYVEMSPSFELLDGPIVTSINRIFDYARGEVAEPVWITGGNPDLGSGNMQNFSLNANVRPFDDQILTLNIGYQQSVSKGAISGFPELTPVIEAAFPERVTRDAEGRLIAVDARTINLASQTNASLSSGVALRFPGQAAPGQGAAPVNPLQLSISLNHNMQLKSELQTRAGIPVIDQLANSGQSRHSLSLQATVGKRGIGTSLNGNWSSPARVTNADQTFRFKPPIIFSLSLFVEPDRLFDQPKKKGMLISDLKFSFDVQNLLNGYRRVTLADGSVPPGYSRDEVDPLGRTARITIRKRF